jgi:ABC-2 type transport system permease protein
VSSIAEPAVPLSAPASAIGTALKLLTPKWLTARARARAGGRGRSARTIALALLAIAFWSVTIVLLYRLLAYFKGVPEIGSLLAGKLLGTLLIGFLGILLLSNVVNALSTFFLARDLDLLVGAPVDWLGLYTAKLIETVINSSWMVVLMALPILATYGAVYHGGPLFPVIALAAFVPYIMLPAIVGSAITLLLVNIFPARRTRDLLSVIAILAASSVVILLRVIRPERLARPEGFRSLVEFVALLRSQSPWSPSDWTQQAVMSWLTGTPDPLPFYLLWSTAAALFVLGAALHWWLYPVGFTKAQESGKQFAKSGALSRVVRTLLAPIGVLRRELVLKELRVFFRDSTQWSQLILLAVLIVVYVFNVKFLPLKTDGVSHLLRNVIPFCNLLVAGFVIGSVAGRFVFPGVSLEGRTWWLLRASPLDIGDLLWAKFWVGTTPLLVLALLIVVVTDTLLEVNGFVFGVSVFTITFLTFAIAALALCFGTLFPQFETENAAQIPTSFGGLVFMMVSVLLIGAVVALEARPVFDYLSAQAATVLGRAHDSTHDLRDLVLGFGLAGLLCIAATIVPIRVALHRLHEIERAG